MVHGGAMGTMRTPPTLPRSLSIKAEPPAAEIRLTIPVSVEVHEAFTRIAQATKQPVGRAMGEWLADTVDAANFMAQTLEKARAAPKLVAQELHAYALGIGDETSELLRKLREEGRAADGLRDARSAPGFRKLREEGRAADGLRDARSAPGGRPMAGPTPPSNTGVTTAKKKARRGGT